MHYSTEVTILPVNTSVLNVQLKIINCTLAFNYDGTTNF